MKNDPIIVEESTEVRRSIRGQRIDAVLWGLFFIWIGVILLAHLPKGVGSLGIGAIVLGGTLARRIFRASVSAFWIIIGTVFVLAGIGELMALNLPLLPGALIVCGVLMLLHHHSPRKGHRPPI